MQNALKVHSNADREIVFIPMSNVCYDNDSRNISPIKSNLKYTGLKCCVNKSLEKNLSRHQWNKHMISYRIEWWVARLGVFRINQCVYICWFLSGMSGCNRRRFHTSYSQMSKLTWRRYSMAHTENKNIFASLIQWNAKIIHN